ncbi:MAG TPA: ferritin-like domain-containing protein, partial [Candidatus Elarobacter sp.]|nr:ferritin-like domain-containing protein [Candidatus Elarobacter sp.]
IDPEIGERLVSRREAIRKGAAVSSTVAAGLAMASMPLALAALSRDVFAQGTPSSVQTVLNFALTLEIFENEFYKAVLGTSASGAQNSAFAPVRATVPASALPAIKQIQAHEAEHVAFLTANGAVNTLNLSATSFDFTGARGAGNGPFAQATTDLNFLLLTAQGAEDTGVRAYKGQAPNLMSNTTVLEAALRIHSVEARHASKIRRLRRQTGAPAVVKYSGTISGGGSAAAGAGNVSNPPAAAVAALDAIYNGEDNTTQGGVNILTLGNLPSGINVSAAATEAFDEPLTMAQVIAIVQPFFIPTLS